MPDSHSAPVPPAWYAGTGRSRWGDWWAVLHPPYTAWHLAYVLVGAGLAAHLNVERLVATLVAFALAVGIAAHAFDEWKGRPLATSIPATSLIATGAAALAGAVALGAIGVTRVGWNLLWFVAVGAGLVVAYNFELWGGRLHNDVVFAVAWGAFPVLTAYYAQTERMRASAVLAAAFAFGLSHAQRVLSTEARGLRRRTAWVEGRRGLTDGTVQPVDRDSLLRPLERALAALSWSVCALGIALVVNSSGH